MVLRILRFPFSLDAHRRCDRLSGRKTQPVASFDQRERPKKMKQALERDQTFWLEMALCSSLVSWERFWVAIAMTTKKMKKMKHRSSWRLLLLSFCERFDELTMLMGWMLVWAARGGKPAAGLPFQCPARMSCK